MIIWLASYPKSGDELVKALLSSYIFSQDGSFHSELLNNIKQFPSNELFKQLGVDINNEEEMKKNYISSQKLFFDEKSIRFLKTHSCFVNRKDFQFTDKHNTLGVIYIVRDPRSVLFSLSNDFKQTTQQSSETILTNQYLGKDSPHHCSTYLGSWKYHYNSWKTFNKFNRYCLIKYEDLINDTETVFLEILKFISRMGKVRFTLEKDKLRNTLNTCDLVKIREFEKKENLSSDKEILGGIEKEFQNEMKELNYFK
tara:strand:+ start:1078 stop:1842 length:765 start_codon:yes stop_codon:yes gene_type:complete